MRHSKQGGARVQALLKFHLYKRLGLFNVYFRFKDFVLCCQPRNAFTKKIKSSTHIEMTGDSPEVIGDNISSQSVILRAS